MCKIFLSIYTHTHIPQFLFIMQDLYYCLRRNGLPVMSACTELAKFNGRRKNMHMKMPNAGIRHCVEAKNEVFDCEILQLTLLYALTWEQSAVFEHSKTGADGD